ncbi:MAG: transporter substrate-binding domain-containing protein [Deltaproteobacteria bacterium]|nr:transporter substrate-binding domain-containing protein [Deltaproteobacteria bacterium]
MKKNMTGKRRVLTITTAVLMTLMFCLAGSVSADDINKQLAKSSIIDKVMRKGTLRIGLASFVPWAMQDKKGEWVGFEIDVAKQLAKDMGVKIEFVPTKWEGLIPSLLTGKFDLIIAGMTGTPQRALKINFTQPYDYSGMNVVVHKDFASGVTDYMDLDKKGNTIIARLGTTGAALAKETYKNAKVRLFPDEGPMVQELLNGKATAFLGSAPQPAQLAAKYPETLVFLDKNLVQQPICMGIPKGDPDTLFYLNNWITTVRNNGFIQKKVNYWWQSLEWEALLK